MYFHPFLFSDNPFFTCDGCQRYYRHRRSLQRHQKYECGKPPSFKCDYPDCSFESKLKCNLIKHQKYKHFLEFNKSCNLIYDAENSQYNSN